MKERRLGRVVGLGTYGTFVADPRADLVNPGNVTACEGGRESGCRRRAGIRARCERRLVEQLAGA
jgi:hypothetical protein